MISGCFTSLLDARFVLGSRSFFTLFQDALWAGIYREKEKLLGKFLLSRKKRVEKYDSENFFVEPDLKEGPGGLRDLHLMSWMARVYFSSRQFKEMRRFSEFSYFEFDDLDESRGFPAEDQKPSSFLDRPQRGPPTAFPSGRPCRSSWITERTPRLQGRKTS